MHFSANQPQPHHDDAPPRLNTPGTIRDIRQQATPRPRALQVRQNGAQRSCRNLRKRGTVYFVSTGQRCVVQPPTEATVGGKKIRGELTPRRLPGDNKTQATVLSNGSYSESEASLVSPKFHHRLSPQTGRIPRGIPLCHRPEYVESDNTRPRGLPL